MSGKTIYVAYFSLGRIESEAQAFDLSELKDGFWVNGDYEFTKGSDCEYWIPPHKIDYIRKTKTA